jgi:hypothetical protein
VGAALGTAWVRAGINTNRPTWGLRGGLLWGLPPARGPSPDGPRGLIRLYYPVLPTGDYDLINFIAIEPIVSGRKGFSELEPSQLDDRPGKRLWAVDAEAPGETVTDLVSGRLPPLKPGTERLSVQIRVERFQNGAHVGLTLSQRSDAPDELELTVDAEPDSAPIEYCILTATMGNKARARQLWLKDEMVSSLELCGDYTQSGFTAHRILPLDRLQRTLAGETLAAITTDEPDPGSVDPAPAAAHWRYRGFPVTQYWKKPAGTSPGNLQVAVNGRYTYWMSRHPIPGGVAFENFEMREPFHPGQRFVFGITCRTPGELGIGPGGRQSGSEVRAGALSHAPAAPDRGLLPRLAAAADGPSADQVLVGVNYFAGWWEPLPNKWNYSPAVGDWRTHYPGRVPLLGEYNSQETMDREIAAAAAHGVGFFLILWYYNGPGDSTEREAHSRLLNEGLRTFIASPEAHRLGFALEYCNHPPYEVKTDRDWEECLRAWLPAFRHPSYLRVGGKLLFKVHSWHHFWRENGENADSCRARLAALRRSVRAAGLGEMLIGCGVAAKERIEAGHPATQFFEFTNTYMDLPNRPPGDTDEPYEVLARFIRESRDQHARDVVPYLPFLGAGFNARPWPDRRARFAFPTREEWTQELRHMRADLERLGTLGLPLPGGGRQKVCTIYAWNEFGEGGMVAPTRGDGYMKLEAIAEVFGRQQQ